MRIDLSGRQALVCASSDGLGRATAFALAGAGATVTINGRDAAKVAATAAALRATGAEVVEVVADIGTEAGRAALLAAMPEPDILIANTGGPPLGDFRDWDAGVWQAALNDLMVAPILMVRGVIDGMQRRRYGRIVTITSVAVRMPMPDRGLTNAAKSGLTGFLAGLSKQVAADNVTINTVLPGFFATQRGESSIAQRAQRAGRDEAAYRAELMGRIPARRMGAPDELAALCCFLAGPSAGYITGQQILVDGGLYPGL